MGIVFIGIGLGILGLLARILVWIGLIETYHDWADPQERQRFAQQQKQWELWSIIGIDRL
jgi:hypothetical protein